MSCYQFPATAADHFYDMASLSSPVFDYISKKWGHSVLSVFILYSPNLLVSLLLSATCFHLALVVSRIASQACSGVGVGVAASLLLQWTTMLLF